MKKNENKINVTELKTFTKKEHMAMKDLATTIGKGAGYFSCRFSRAENGAITVPKEVLNALKDLGFKPEAVEEKPQVKAKPHEVEFFSSTGKRFIKEDVELPGTKEEKPKEEKPKSTSEKFKELLQSSTPEEHEKLLEYRKQMRNRPLHEFAEGLERKEYLKVALPVKVVEERVHVTEPIPKIEPAKVEKDDVKAIKDWVINKVDNKEFVINTAELLVFLERLK